MKLRTQPNIYFVAFIYGYDQESTQFVSHTRTSPDAPRQGPQAIGKHRGGGYGRADSAGVSPINTRQSKKTLLKKIRKKKKALFNTPKIPPKDKKSKTNFIKAPFGRSGILATLNFQMTIDI